MTTESHTADPTEQKPTSSAGDLKPDGATPDYLVPKMGEVGLNEPAYYRSLFILDTLGPGSGQLEELKGPIDPLDDAFDDDKLPKGAELKPAFGALTVHEQVWRQKGMGLGNLLQSVCLAPGEVTQVAVTRWEHKTTGTSTEATDQSESVSSQAEQNRAVNEVQRAVAKEAQWGTSSAFSSSASVQAGASWLIGSASGSSTTSTALTAQFSAGSRDLAAESTNAIAQRTAETSQSLRSRRQSVVREVSEQEAESLSTRVLANYNRRHTLNVLFFEVLQIYEVKTVLRGWDRCLFVPMVPIDFKKKPEVIEKHRAQLLSVFQELGAKEMIDLLGKALGPEKKGTPDAYQRMLSDNLQELKKGKDLVADLDTSFWPMWRKYVKQYPSETARDSIPEFKALKEHYGPEHQEWSRIRDKHFPKQKAGTSPTMSEFDERISKAERELAAYEAGQSVQNKIPVEEQLNRHRLFLSQQLWLRMSPYRVYRILQRYKIDGQEQPLSALVDPQPIGVFGNYLAFRWGFANTDEGMKQRKSFEETYLKPKPEGESHTVGLPTSGVFAEAVLGQSLAAEQIDKRFGKWGDEGNKIPILPPKIADLQSRDRAKGMDLKAQDFASSLAQLRAEKLSDVSYIDKALGQVGKGDMFRDMGGLAQAVSLADKLAALSAEGATKAGDRAAQLQSKVLDTFEKVIDSKVGQAAVAEFMLPGSGAALLGAGKKGGESETEHEKDAVHTPEPAKP